MSIYQQLGGNAWKEIEVVEASHKRSILGKYNGEWVKVGPRIRTEGEGSHQELHVYRSGPWKVYHKVHQNEVRTEKA